MAEAVLKPDENKINIVSFQIKESEFEQFRSLIYAEAGINLSAHKKYLLVNRLSKRLKHLGLSNFSDYLHYLDRSPMKNQEMIELIDAITTNKTDFFREPKHFTFLQEKVLPNHKGNETFRVWSCASSTGEEPYTIAMCLSEYSDLCRKISFDILGSDICETVLRTAVAGIYKEETVADIPYPLLRKYFLRGNGRFKVKPDLARNVKFRKINLKHNFQTALHDYHVVFCRNVFIYFDKPTQEQIIEKFWHVLKPGGYLFLGHSETFQGMKTPFQYVEPSIYQKISQ